ncbi:hypothetical protein ACFQZR_10185 [Paenibacillus sp. GCM10027629]|uniref:hypothetical protein n=1 Tax=Paenibacillus sp. GCM10027629 TaxID=3273414 RepID=UPI003642A5FE
MGFDVLLFDNRNRLILIHEIDENLHKDIFAPYKLWASYLFLRKLSDYYCTNEEFSGKAMDGLKNDLINYKPLMDVKYQTTLQLLLDAISDNNVRKIRINGD